MMNKYKNYIVFGCQGVATWLLMCFICVCFYVIPSVARRFLLAWFKSLSLGLIWYSDSFMAPSIYINIKVREYFLENAS